MRARIAVSIVVVALLAGLLPELLVLPTASAHHKIKITVPAAAVTFASLYHAKTAGYFAEEGLDVEIITPGSSTTPPRRPCPR
jgi:ABC-type nitrate/sulfonate/bicarbonate transport system substrate-binding protein